MALWNKKLRYHQRLFLWLLLYSLLFTGCFTAFQYSREKEFKQQELNLRLQLVNMHLLKEVEAGRPIRGKNAVDAGSIYCAPAGFDDALRISVIDSLGRVVYDNSLDSLPSGNHLSREEIREAVAEGEGYTVRRHSESTGATYFYSARLGHNGTVVRTAVPYSASLGEMLRADYRFIWLTSGTALMLCILGFFVTRRIGVYVGRLRSFAEKAEKGERISDSEPFPHDELGDISNHIVSLYASLQQAISDRDREHREALHQQSEKERIKKQLTNNINHELKTPVASVHACLETMLGHPDMSPEKRREFLERCIAGTDRLRSLLADVALITRIDDGGDAIRKEEVCIDAIARKSVEQIEVRAGNAGFLISLKSAENIRINGNPQLLSSIFDNLLANALAYSGGTRIDIRVERLSDGTVEVIMADNGIGIRDEHLPHIFERFYRIDKGRSRAAGGTGLGLAIVKNAVIFHGGTIRAYNLPGGGLGFRIRI